MNTSKNSLSQANDGFDIFKEIRYYMFFWPWLLVSVLLFSFGAYFYLRYANIVYNTSATLQVKDASSDPSSFLTGASGAMFDFGRVKMGNFIAQIGSKPNLTEVAERLELQTNVYAVGRFKEYLLFGDEVPFQIVFKTEFSGAISLTISSSSQGLLELGDDSIPFDLALPFENEDFVLTVQENKVKEEQIFLINRSSKYSAVEFLSENVDINSSLITGDNISLSLQGTNKKRNEAIINTIIKVSHEQQIKDKQEIFALSIDFINNRLSSIKTEIDSLTLQTTGFKSDNLIFSPEVQTTAALTSISTIDQQQFALTTQRALANSLKANLKNQANFSLLPSNIGLESANVNELVLSYNEMVLRRKNLLNGASTLNPLVIQISDQLTDLKRNIFSSIDNYLSNIDTSLGKYKEFANRTNSVVSKIPKLEATLLGFERRFQIAEKLFLFLLERREEASISYKSTLPNTRVINNAFTNSRPLAPKRQLTYLRALFIGLFIPLGFLFLRKRMDTKIHTREDLEKLIPNIDIMGEVPFIEDIQSIKDSRGIFAESSRVIRSNISFKLNRDQSNVILCTSSIKGEGKTLTAFNTAASYLATGKKVLLIGADLRNPQLHSLMNIDRKSNLKGLSTIIANESLEVSKDAIATLDLFNNQLDILLSGPIPPNPAELLNSKVFSDLLKVLKESYDYIIIDSAPLVLVSDTLPLLEHADLVLYTTRAHYTDKKLIPFINSLITDKKVTNMGLVFNGIKAGAHSKSSNSYQYNYGYGYGYGEDKS